MKINEPMTMLTDYIIAIETFVFAILLFRISRSSQQISIKLWSIAFSAISVAAILGGTYHGFFLYIDKKNQFLLWKATDYSVSLASNFMLLGTVVSSILKRFHKPLFIGIGLKFLFYIGISTRTDDFRFLIADYLSAMFLVLMIHLKNIYHFWTNNYWNNSTFWIISGILVSFIAASIQQSGFQLVNYFNHNDLYHLVKMLALYMFYQGARLLKDW
jgi:hypothetical protein